MCRRQEILKYYMEGKLVFRMIVDWSPDYILNKCNIHPSRPDAKLRINRWHKGQVSAMAQHLRILWLIYWCHIYSLESCLTQIHSESTSKGCSHECGVAEDGGWIWRTCIVNDKQSFIIGFSLSRIVSLQWLALYSEGECLFFFLRICRQFSWCLRSLLTNHWNRIGVK